MLIYNPKNPNTQRKSPLSRGLFHIIFFEFSGDQ